MRARRWPILAAVVLLLPAMAVGGGYPAAPEERAYLGQIAEELELLLSLVARAERDRDQSAVVLFDYTALRSDLQQIRRSLLDHLSGASRLPRKIQPLQLRFPK